MLYLNVASLLPQFAESYHPKYNSLDIGILFSSYQIAFLIVANLRNEILFRTKVRDAALLMSDGNRSVMMSSHQYDIQIFQLSLG